MPMWFSGNELPPSTAYSSETDLMKDASLKQKQISQKIIPSVAKNRKIHKNTEIENTRFDFNTLNHLEESINKYDRGDGSEWEKEFFRRY